MTTFLTAVGVVVAALLLAFLTVAALGYYNEHDRWHDEDPL